MNLQERISDGPPSGLTPILVVTDANEAAAFYQQAFDALELARIPAPDGKRFLHIRLRAFGSVFVIMDEFPELSGEASLFRSPEKLNGTSVTLHLQVVDAYRSWEQAIEAGASATVPMQRQFWGEYYGRLKDPFGHEWTIAQMIVPLSAGEVENAAKSFLT